ncbi:glycosyltransferase family 4 protein [Thiosocius teredinicola]|uniref:glycosyltransferase family 4 protein n=1 Tax=Thiosocius teredinicola TaxID=1973002 RepID=UPI000990FDC1
MRDIVYVSNATIPSRTANSIHVVKMCEALARRGRAVELIYPNAGTEKDCLHNVFEFYGASENFRLTHIARPKLRGARQYFAFRAAIRAWLRHSVIYSRNLHVCYYAVRLGLPVVYESHAPIVSEDLVSLKMFRAAISSRNFRKLVVITHALKELYQREFLLQSDKIAVLPDAASPVPQRLPPMEAIRDEALMNVGYIGQLYRGKGMELISKLAPLCPWAKFHIVGGLEVDIEKWKGECSELANMTFHGFVPHADVQRFMLAMDVVLLPNQAYVAAFGGGHRNISEWTSPLKAFEYMAAGKAIVASDLPVLREVFVPEKNALLCSPEDPHDWSDALQRLAADRVLKERLEATALADFEARYSWDARAGAVEGFLE